jgi:hypothetical protein
MKCSRSHFHIQGLHNYAAAVCPVLLKSCYKFLKSIRRSAEIAHENHLQILLPIREAAIISPENEKDRAIGR